VSKPLMGTLTTGAVIVWSKRKERVALPAAEAAERHPCHRRGFVVLSYCWSSSTRSPRRTGSSANTIIPVAVLGVVPRMTISPTARRGISAI